MTTITQLITRTLELDDEATSGPWEHHYNADCILTKDCEEDEVVVVMDMHMKPDADLMAEYRTAAPLLAKECQRLQKDLDEANEELLQWMTGIVSRDELER